MLDSFEVSKTLIIAPLRVARDTWPDEVGKWDHLKNLDISVMVGDVKQRVGALNHPALVYVINRENIKWLVEYYERNGLRWDFDMVVIDELSSFKSHQSQRFKWLRKVRPFVKRMVGLTGTPASNGLMDLWAEVGILDGGQRLGKFIGRFREAYFKPGGMNPASETAVSYTTRLITGFLLRGQLRNTACLLALSGGQEKTASGPSRKKSCFGKLSRGKSGE